MNGWYSKKGQWHAPPIWLILLLLILVAAAPLYAPGELLNTRGGGDSPFLLQRTQQMATALADGHFPVRWMPDANYGYGYPFFNFYAPLSIYVAALLHLWGFSLVSAIQLTQLAAFALAAYATYRLGQRWSGSQLAGVLAAAAYTLAPFHLVNVYVRGDSLAEFWAMTWYPVILLAADNLLAAQDKRRVWQAIALFGFSYAALILSHNISALIFSPFLLLYLLLQAWGHTPDPMLSIRRAVTALLLGLGLSAWFWLPALAEQNLAQLTPVTAGYFHYSGHFRGANLVQPGFFFNYDVGVGSGGPFRLGLVQFLLTLAGLLTWWRQQAAALLGSRRLFITLSLLLAAFMITPLSQPLWDHLPLLPFTQFPWRFLSVLALMGALATAGLASTGSHRSPKSTAPVIAVLATTLLLLSSLGRLSTDYLRLTDADVTAARLAEYEWFTGNIGSTVSAEYLPPWVQPRPYTSAWLTQGERDAAQPIDGQATIQLLTRQAARQQWQIAVASKTAVIRLPTLFWPGWTARLDGTPTPLTATGSGLMQVDVPAGTHTLDLTLRRTPVRLVAELLSLVVWLLAVWLLRDYVKRVGWRWLLAGGVALLAVGLRLWPATPAPTANNTWDFAQMGYLHHDNVVSFSNGAALNAYDITPKIVTAGQPLTIRLRWQTGAPEPATLTLVSPAINLTTAVAVEPLAAATLPTISGESVYTLMLPADAPGGLFLPRLTFATGQPLLPSGQTRGDLFLSPVRVIPASDTTPPAVDGPAVRVNAAAIVGKALRLHLAWWTPTVLPANLSVSLRLVDSLGARLSQFDTQPGYGFLPSGDWLAAVWVNDWLALPLPDRPAANQVVTIQLYDMRTGETYLTRRLGELTARGDGALAFRPTQPVYELPASITPQTATFGNPAALGGDIALRGYTATQTGDRLHLTLYWQALLSGQTDYFHFVHLLHPTTGDILAQDDAMPQGNSYPTSQWTAGEIVADSVSLDLTGVPAGNYLIAVGLYAHLGEGHYARLPAFDAAGVPLPDNRLLLPLYLTAP
ncbi:MAG: hypothetical protein Fur0021_38410 [Candidatus Promineifilaceae bacterium]